MLTTKALRGSSKAIISFSSSQWCWSWRFKCWERKSRQLCLPSGGSYPPTVSVEGSWRQERSQPFSNHFSQGAYVLIYSYIYLAKIKIKLKKVKPPLILYTLATNFFYYYFTKDDDISRKNKLIGFMGVELTLLVCCTSYKMNGFYFFAFFTWVMRLLNKHMLTTGCFFLGSESSTGIQ